MQTGKQNGTSLFLSADECSVEGKTFHIGASIPIAKALAREVLLAYAMNGEAPEAEHGAPLRVVVPGHAGVRSPKWVHTVAVQDRPSDNPMQADVSKLFPPHVTKATFDPRHGITINAMPVNSAICEPAPHARLSAGPASIRGYAMASDRSIARVDVSGDGGRTWQQAELDSNPGAPWPGRSGRRRSTCRSASTSLPCGPGTPPDGPSRLYSTRLGTSRATGSPLTRERRNQGLDQPPVANPG